MTITRIASGITLVLGLAILLAPSDAAAQSRTRANTDRITPIATAGCSGASWARFRTAAGTGYPVVTQVESGSPADQAGVREGDVILSVNGRDARTMDSWFIAAPGKEVVVRIQRGEKQRDLHVTAGRVLELAPEKGAMQCVQS